MLHPNIMEAITAVMFHTIGHTFELMKMSWRVLMKDKELIWFPIFGVIGSLVILGIFFLIASATGAVDRIQEITNQQNNTQAAGQTEAAANPGDIVLLVLLYISVYFVTIFFNSALIAAALERLRGGDPNIRSGLAVASKHIPQILGWAIISASVGLLLQILRSRQDNFLGRMVIDMIGGAWSFMTFFVVPVLVNEGKSPIGSIKRSASMVRETWGRQITASFGFQLVYLIAGVIAVLPAFLVFTVFPIGGIIVGVITVSIALGVVGALEGIFKAALYEYALGEKPVEFNTEVLKSAYMTDLRAQPYR